MNVLSLEGMTQSQKAAFRSIYIPECYEVVEESLEKGFKDIFYYLCIYKDIFGELAHKSYMIGKRGKVSEL